MKTQRFEQIVITFGTKDIYESWAALCACIAESEQFLTEGRAPV